MPSSRAILIGFAVLAQIAAPRPGAAQQRLSFEFGTGLPYNPPLPLTIRQSGQPDIDLTARYYSEPFVVPISWDWKIGYWSYNHGWELEAVHHKIFLDNRPKEVQEFAVTHGLNIITLNRVWYLGHYLIRIGAGVSLAHPETVVRGKALAQNLGIFHTGYYISGPALNLAAGRRFLLTGGLFFSAEAKLFASYSSIPIQDGTAYVPHVAVQAGISLGYDVDL